MTLAHNVHSGLQTIFECLVCKNKALEVGRTNKAKIEE